MAYAYSPYWRAWDRILGPGSFEGEIVVMAVTPNDWRRAAAYRWANEAGTVRTHCTAPECPAVDEIPADVRAALEAHVGAARAAEILGEPGPGPG